MGQLKPGYLMGINKPPVLCSHRGLRIACPENTVPASAAGGDGVPALCHDISVGRTTGGSDEILKLVADGIPGRL